MNTTTISLPSRNFCKPHLFCLILTLGTMLAARLPLNAQCAALPTQPSCSPCTASSSSDSNITNTRCFSGGSSTYGNYSINGGVLIICSGSLQINGLSFGSSGGTIYIATGATLQIGNNGGNGVPNLDGNVTIVNRGTLSFTAGFSMQGSNTNRIFTASGATTNIAGEVSLNSSASSLVNYGTVNANGGLRYQGGTTCMGLTSCINTTNLTVNSNNPLSAPSGAAAIRVTGQRQFNNPITATSNVRFCRGSASTQNGGNEPSGYGSATIVSNCPSCNVALPNVITTLSGEAIGGKVYLRWQSTALARGVIFFVERLNHLGDFEAIQQLASDGQTRQWQVVDEVPQQGRNYYRLRVVLPDGNEAFSQILSLAPLSPEALEGISISPNPTYPNTEGLIVKGLPAGAYRLEIRNVLGQLLQVEILNVEDKAYWYALPPVLRQAKGLSYWQIRHNATGRVMHTQRVMLQE